MSSSVPLDVDSLGIVSNHRPLPVFNHEPGHFHKLREVDATGMFEYPFLPECFTMISGDHDTAVDLFHKCFNRFKCSTEIATVRVLVVRVREHAVGISRV